MGKHQKKLRAEKAKVKLKGAKLPKGANETKTDFKVKKIIIKEQLKDSLLEDGKRVQTVKEIVNRLKNSNTNFRLDGLKQLRDGVVLQNTLKHLGEVVQAVASLSLDMDRDVRRDSFKVLGLIFQVASVNSIRPFFDILTSYLGCAMTHIQPGIQEDSLLFLDTLYAHVPTLVASNSDKIFSNFLNMISKLNNESNSKRSLTTNTSGNMTTVKWRKKVLDRLNEMLKALLAHRISLKTNSKIGGRSNVQQKIFIVNKPIYINLIRNHLNRSCNLSEIFNKTVGSEIHKSRDEEMQLKSYIEQLMPIIFQAWLEVRLSRDDTARNSFVVLSTDAAQTLKIVLEILDMLWSLISKLEEDLNHSNLSTWFTKTFKDDFIQHIPCHFPYQQSEGTQETKKKSRGLPTVREVIQSGGQYCLHQNLSIIHLFCTISRTSMDKYPKLVEAILAFVAGMDLRNLPMEVCVCYEKALRSILYTNGGSFLKMNRERTRELLTKILHAFNEGKISYDLKLKVLVLICDIVLCDDLYNSYGTSTFDNWLPTLPSMLHDQKISIHAVKTLSNLGKQKNKVFLDALRDSTHKVIENIQNIQVIEMDNTFEGTKLIMNLFFWINDWASLKCEDLLKHVETHISDKKVSNYFTYILEQSFNKMQNF